MGSSVSMSITKESILDAHTSGLQAIGRLIENVTTCFACLHQTDVERAHIIPRNRGGLDTPENIHLLCYWCHLASDDLVPPEYDQWLLTRSPTDSLVQASIGTGYIQPSQLVDVTPLLRLRLLDELPPSPRVVRSRRGMTLSRQRGIKVGRPSNSSRYVASAKGASYPTADWWHVEVVQQLIGTGMTYTEIIAVLQEYKISSPAGVLAWHPSQVTRLRKLDASLLDADAREGHFRRAEKLMARVRQDARFWPPNRELPLARPGHLGTVESNIRAVPGGSYAVCVSALGANHHLGTYKSLEAARRVRAAAFRRRDEGLSIKREAWLDAFTEMWGLPTLQKRSVQRRGQRGPIPDADPIP